MWQPKVEIGKRNWWWQKWSFASWKKIYISVTHNNSTTTSDMYMTWHDKSTEGLCCDYQQNIPVLAVTTGELFYLRQVWVYNMGIYSCKTGCTKMYTNDETAGKKGSNECVSLVKYYIDIWRIWDPVSFQCQLCRTKYKHSDGLVFKLSYCIRQVP